MYIEGSRSGKRPFVSVYIDTPLGKFVRWFEALVACDIDY